jgi:hypothetical protein
MNTAAAGAGRTPGTSGTPALALGRLIFVPVVVTLAVTLLRLLGELEGWSPSLFSRAPGGGGSPVGISWLVPIFGAWFGWRLARGGEWPGGALRATALLVAAIAAVPVCGLAAGMLGLGPTDLRLLYLYAGAAVVGLVLALRAWPALGRTLLAYALAARVPVAVVMLLAMLGNWGTHYDVAPAGFPEMPTLSKWFTIGVLPQMTIWLWFTVSVGLLFGLVAGAIARRRSALA